MSSFSLLSALSTIVYLLCYCFLYVDTAPLALILRFISTKIGHKYTEFISLLMWRFCSCVLELCMGIKFCLYGDTILDGRSCIFLPNHSNETDWIYFAPVVSRENQSQPVKYVAKTQIRVVPGIGWMAQFAIHLFFSRESAEDSRKIREYIRYFSNLDTPVQLLLFPEATNMHRKTKAKSDAYARMHGYPCYDYVLHPRTGGFVKLTQAMRHENMLDDIYDIDFAYPKGAAYSCYSLIKGRTTPEVHIRIKRFSLKDIPTEDDELEKFCRGLWAAKEQRLETFYKNGYFEKDLEVLEPDRHYRLWLWFYLLLATLLITSNLLGLYWSSFWRVYTLLVVGGTTALSYFNGVDGLLMKL